MNILEIKNVSKSFSDKEVLKEVSFEVPENGIVGFIGQNGAGKTTLMKMIVGLLKIDTGEIQVCGGKVFYGNNRTNQFIGYLPDVPEFYGYMTAEDYLKLCGEVSNMPDKEMNERIQELLELVGLKDIKEKIKSYSRGMKQRLGIAQALLNKPKLLICDEPTSALDPLGRQDILNILSQVKKETTVIFSTHVLSDVEKICDHYVLLHEGSIQMNLSKEEFQEKYYSHTIQVILKNSEDTLKLQEAFTPECTVNQNECLITAAEVEKTQRELFSWCLENHVLVETITIYQPSLETVFTEVVK